MFSFRGFLLFNSYWFKYLGTLVTTHNSSPTSKFKIPHHGTTIHQKGNQDGWQTQTSAHKAADGGHESEEEGSGR
jgi:hypothetical protein